MAFRDTSERYEYIYGSNVKKLDRETAGQSPAVQSVQGILLVNQNMQWNEARQQVLIQKRQFRRIQPDFWHLTGSIR